MIEITDIILILFAREVLRNRCQFFSMLKHFDLSN